MKNSRLPLGWSAALVAMDARGLRMKPRRAKALVMLAIDGASPPIAWVIVWVVITDTALVLGSMFVSWKANSPGGIARVVKVAAVESPRTAKLHAPSLTSQAR